MLSLITLILNVSLKEKSGNAMKSEEIVLTE